MIQKSSDLKSNTSMLFVCLFVVPEIVIAISDAIILRYMTLTLKRTILLPDQALQILRAFAGRTLKMKGC